MTQTIAVEMAIGPLSDCQLPMSNGLSRLQSRFLADPNHAARLAKEQPRVDGARCRRDSVS